MDSPLTQHLEELKRLSLGWMIKRGSSLAEAEDLFQQSVMKALTTTAELQDEEKLQSWFMSILKNTFLDHVRRNKLILEKNQEYQLLQEDPEIETIFCKCVNGYLEEIPAQERTLLQEHFFEGKSFSALAKEHSLKEGTLRVTAHRARERLKQMFKACCNVRKFRDLEDCGCG